eukprot:1851888-Prymnesium_polylepis.1
MAQPQYATVRSPTFNKRPSFSSRPLGPRGREREFTALLMKNKIRGASPGTRTNRADELGPPR